jgi:Flp pilus assembly protein TadG
MWKRSHLAGRGGCRRQGATLVEMTLVILLFLTLVLGMLDLGIMVTRSQSLSQAARSGARAAIVRGEFAEVLGSLGSTAYSGTANDNQPIANAVRSQLILMNPANVRLNVTWPEGSNEVGKRVHVTVAADFTPLVTFVFGSPTWTLIGSSEMHIAH